MPLRRYILLFTILVLMITMMNCQPRETYKPPKDYYAQFEDMEAGQRKDKDKEQEEEKEKRDKPLTKPEERTSWEDLEDLEESWLEDWGDTQHNLRKGMDYFKVHLYEKAQDEFQKAIEYDPDYAPAYIELGRTFIAKDMPYAAEKALIDATKINPSLPRSFYYLGVVYCTLWKIEDDPKYKELANENVRLALKVKKDIPDPEDILDGDCIKPIEKDFYQILIKSEPVGVSAFLGDTELGNTPITIKTKLDKLHDINAQKEGYITDKKSVRFGEGQTATLTIKMREELGITEEKELAAEGIVLEHDAIFFDLDKAKIREESYPVLDKIGEELLKFPEYKTEINGHTCNLGTEEYNKDLSLRRANAVKDYLINEFDINADRLIVHGYGETMPIASNESEKGRKKNRRTEIVILNE